MIWVRYNIHTQTRKQMLIQSNSNSNSKSYKRSQERYENQSRKRRKAEGIIGGFMSSLTSFQTLEP